MAAKHLTLLLGGMLVLTLGAATVAQQLPPTNPYVPGYYPPWYNPYSFGAGGILQGQASVISASAEATVQMEKARIEREKANQEKIETKRKAFDQMMYEKANTLTYTDEQKWYKDRKLSRIVTNPSQGEITSGTAMNIMMPYVKDMSIKGTMGPPILIDQELLRHINVAAAAGSNLGALKDPTQLDWPIVVQGPKQEKLAAALPQIVSQTINGNLNQKTYKAVKSQVTELQEDLRQQFRKEEIDGGEYLTGKRFLDSIEEAVKALPQPGSKKVLDGAYAAKGRSVPELVYNMEIQGLLFAPSNPGDEPAYRALSNLFIAFINGTNSGAGFQVRLPTTLERYKDLDK